MIEGQTGGSQEPGDDHVAVEDVCDALYVLKLWGEMTKPKPKPKPRLSRFWSNTTNTELNATVLQKHFFPSTGITLLSHVSRGAKANLASTLKDVSEGE